MTVGAPQDMSAINNNIVSIVAALRNAFHDQIPNLANWYANQTPTTLAALGYTPNDITLLGNLIPSLQNLAAVAQGQQAQPVASNFMYWPLQALGAQ